MCKCYGCFSCGKINGEIRRDADNNVVCGECGKLSILSIREAYDVANLYFREHTSQGASEEVSELHEEYGMIEEILDLLEEGDAAPCGTTVEVCKT